MTAMIPSLSARRVSWLAIVRERQPTLAGYAMWLFALTLPVLTASLIDPRTIDGVSVWLKPAKFLISVAIYALTTAWFFGYVRPARRRSPPMRALVATIVATGSLEIGYIAVQAARALPSHFNRSSMAYELLYGAMGIAAVLLIGTAAVLAWEIARRPSRGVDAVDAAAAIIGLSLCFLLGGGLGLVMAQGTGHSVGATGGHVPLFGWNRRGGDLRIAHFLGVHAQQAVPLIALAVRRWTVRWRVAALSIGTTGYVAATVAVFIQALAGRALLPM